jgi:hypothetical protein
MRVLLHVLEVSAPIHTCPAGGDMGATKLNSKRVPCCVVLHHLNEPGLLLLVTSAAVGHLAPRVLWPLPWRVEIKFQWEALQQAA